MGRTEDGPEDTSAYPGGVIPSGINGSYALYVHPDHKGNRPTPDQAARLAAVRQIAAERAAARVQAERVHVRTYGARS